MNPIPVVLLGGGPVLVEEVRRPLLNAGHVLTVLGNADQIDAIVAAAPRVILVAGRVGMLEGWDVVDRLRGRPELAKVALVMVSPDDSIGGGGRDQACAVSLGVGHLRVPFSPVEVLEVVGSATRRKKQILLVDDSVLIHRHTTPILEEAGYEVLAAFDGAEALELADQHGPDLCITDVEMPRYDGYEVCRLLKQQPRPIPVIICSALGETQDLERGFDAGADDYLVKPAQPDELLSRIRHLLTSVGLEHSQRERLLVADDSPAIRHLVADALTRQGFAVTTAVDGQDALEKARVQRFDMLITDYDMPRMTGFELVHAWRRDPSLRDLPTMMLTARNTRRDQALMRAAGLTTYLVKPFSVDKCVAMVERLLAERRLRAYKEASRLYISEGAVRAAEETARSHETQRIRADEREMAVLFTDICGFTAMSQRMEPRAVVDMLNGVFDVLCPPLKAEGGDIDKFIGDAIMAVFEPLPDVDSAALRAVRAAIKMQAALEIYRQHTPHAVHIRIGINLGPVVRGDIGSYHVRRDYTVVGDTVNRAQRLESTSPADGILVGELVQERTVGQVDYEARPGLHFKNIDHPVTAYLVKGLLPTGAS